MEMEMEMEKSESRKKKNEIWKKTYFGNKYNDFIGP